jgi:membrane protein implicated in regulation of membrane protease activity
MDATIWLILIVAFLAIEANTVSLVSAWFAAGSLAALIASLCGAQPWLQITLFLVVAAVSLACLRPLVRKYIKPRIIPTNTDAILNSQGYVTEDIDNIGILMVKKKAKEFFYRHYQGFNTLTVRV